MLIVSPELLAGNAFRGQTEPVAVKCQRPTQVVDRESNNANLRLHLFPIFSADNTRMSSALGGKTSSFNRWQVGIGELRMQMKRPAR
jgi:hypothetical protein